MDQEAIIQYIAETFIGVEIVRPTDGPGVGDTFVFYDPRHDLDPARRLPLATVVTKDYGDFDNTSRLSRPDVFRLNIGVSRDSFQTLFGFPPSEAPARSGDYNFAALDRLLPHPVYAEQAYVCVLNPSAETFENVKPLLAEAYNRAVARYASRQGKTD